MKESFFTESILYWAARGLSFTACKLPPRVNTAIGSSLGRLLCGLLVKRRVVALGNLKAAFGEAYTASQYHRILTEAFQNLGITFMEIAQIPRIDRRYVDRWVEVAPGSREHLEAALAKGRGVIILAAHFGNWEFPSITAALHGYPSLVLAREQGWPKLNQLLNQYRESRGCRVIKKGFPIREVIRGLGENRMVGILSDQDGGRHGVLAPFFGRLASTAPGAVALALNAGAQILPIFMVRKAGPLHTLIAQEPLVVPQEGDLEDRIQRGMADYLKRLEEMIRRHPSQWLWLHRRWKSSPERRVLLLSDGKAGHRNQLEGFAQRIEAAWAKRSASDKRLRGRLQPTVRIERVEVQFRHPALKVLTNLFAGIAPQKFPSGLGLLKLALTPSCYRRLSAAYADLSVSCGSATAGANLLWAWGIGAKAIHITRSRWPHWNRFHLSVIPRHDRVAAGPKVWVVDGSLTPLGRVEEQQVERWRQRLGLNDSLQVGLLLGGPTRGVQFPPQGVEEILGNLIAACERLGAELLVTSSRRTPREVEEILKRRLGKHPRCRLLTLVNAGQAGALDSAQEAVPCIFNLADLIVVSGDSISMVSEAVASGKPVVSFLPGSTNGSKHQRFLSQMDSDGKLTFVPPGSLTEAIVRSIKKVKKGTGTFFPETPAPLEKGASPQADPLVEKLVQWL